MPDAASEPRSKRLALHKRPWVVMSTILLILVGIAGYLYLFHDSPPPYDADLIPEFSLKSGGENPLATFSREMAAHKTDDWAGLPEEARTWKAGQEPVLQAYLDKHATQKGLLEALLRTDPDLWRWKGVDASFSVQSEFSDLTPCMTAANQLGKTEIILLHRAGRHAEAAEKAIQQVKFGSQLAKLDGALIHLLVGMSVQRVGEQLIRTTLTPVSDESLLRQTQEALAAYDLPSTSVARTFRIEYLFSRNSPMIPDKATQEFWGLKDWEILAMTYLTLPNRTGAEYCDRSRRLIQGLDRNWISACETSREISRENSQQYAEGWKSFLRPNAGGRILSRFGWRASLPLVTKACGSEALHHMTIVTLALRRHELVHGHLPDTLQELVPEFLKEVPLDPFDGQPLRWDATKKWLYSVSENLTDNHGTHDRPEKPDSNNPDLVMPYWWLPEVVKE
ncbi:MAG: hypothetical protein ACAH88_05185 [Roseimicrobium sp.]